MRSVASTGTPETSSIDDDARDIVTRRDSYTETPPSGTGFRARIEGELPGWEPAWSVEMYEPAWFFTMAGDRVDVKPQAVNERKETTEEESDGFAESFTAASSGPSAETRGVDAGESTAEQTDPGDPPETARTETGNPAESTDAGTSGSSGGRERVYLKERNKVLSAKLEQREATIEQRRERIETLEAELTELRTSSASTTHEQTTHDETSADESDSSGNSLWGKAERLVDGSHS